MRCQANAWTDHDIFIYWLNQIRFSPSLYKSIKNSLLILDRATTHFDANLREEFNKRESTYVLIPPGLTTYLQPLDVGVNKEIKQFMKQADTHFRIKNKNIRPPNENEIINMFRDIWYNNVKKQSILNSFKKTSISIKMDITENNLVNLPEIIIDNFEKPEFFINKSNNNLESQNLIILFKKL